MNAAERQAWMTENQRGFSAALAALRRTLEGVAGAPLGGPGAPGTSAADAGGGTESARALALDVLTSRFRLSAFERELLLLAVAPELDACIAELLSRLQPGSGRRTASFALALGVLKEPHWSALGTEAPLRRWRLLEVGASELLVQAPLRVDERVLHFLLGVPAFDERLRPAFRPVRAAGPITDAHRVAARRGASSLRAAGRSIVLQVASDSVIEARAVAGAIAADLGSALFLLDARDLPEPAADREALARLWEREAALSGGLLAIEGTEEDGEARKARAWLEQLDANALVLGGRGPGTSRRAWTRLDLPRHAVVEVEALWRASLGPLAEPLNGALTSLSREFRVAPEDIRSVASQLTTEFAGAGPDAGPVGGRRNRAGTEPSLSRRLRSLCLAQARVPLEALAQRIEPVAKWDDLVLPAETRQRLREIVVHAKHRHRIAEEWGFASRGQRGLGLAALFSGPSGTGKTMAAEVLARELDLELFRIDLSAVVSKYIGETEKNLRRVFDAAESGVAILLFDEADALFGKRTEVKDSHDRYANIEVSYLLQRMEAYRGVAILTTNLKASLDTAFLRRLRFIVPFPFPDAAQRAEIWRRVFPAQTPTDGLDPRRLAQLNVSGGNIRNIALGAAVLAAEAGEPVRMSHLRDAARAECAKLERPVSEPEFAGWVSS